MLDEALEDVEKQALDLRHELGQVQTEIQTEARGIDQWLKFGKVVSTAA